jgi:hypothetical protein
MKLQRNRGFNDSNLKQEAALSIEKDPQTYLVFFSRSVQTLFMEEP